MTDRQCRPSTRAWAWALLVCGLLLVAAEAAVFCQYGATVYDEAGYTYEGWLTVQHGLLPFRDFYAKVPPLLYYLYGTGQALLGPSFLLGRLQAVGFTLVTLALAAVLARRLAGKWAAVLVVWLFAASPAAVNIYFHAYSQAPTALLIMLAFFLVLHPRRGPAKLVLGALATTGFLLCRHDLLPLAVGLWAYVLWRYPVSRGWRWGATAVVPVVFAAVLLPFYLLAPVMVIYCLTAGAIGPAAHLDHAYGVSTQTSAFTVAWHVMIFLRYYAACLLLLVPGLAWAYGALRGREPGAAAGTWEPLGVLLGVSALNWLGRVAAAVLLGLNIPYLLDMYIYFPVALAAAVVAARLLAAAAGSQGWRNLAGAGVVMAVLFAPVLTGPMPLFRLSRERPTAVERIRQGAAFIRQHTTPEDRILTFDDPHQFLEAGRVIIPDLTHELFSYRESRETAGLKSLHLFNDEVIKQWLSGEATVVVTSAAREEWMIHSGRYAGGARLHRLFSELLARNYVLVAEAAGTFDGPTRIYRWRGPAARATTP